MSDQSKPPGPVPAAGYLRRSKTDQELSLEQQQADIERYAREHGYRITRWYTDNGVSGDNTGKRNAFRQMHSDALNGGRFQAILCWDQDRFGRFDSVEAGYWIHPLRQAGVRLVTVTEGPVDWSNFTGRVIYSLKQEAKHQFLHDLARRIVRGQRNNAERGGWNGGLVPYGFDRAEFTPDGRFVRRLAKGDRKRAGHIVRLVPTEDEHKLAAIRQMFQRYADSDVSTYQLAGELTAAGYASPTGQGWTAAAVRVVLRNAAYCGTLRWGAYGRAKYAPTGAAVVTPGIFEPIIEPDLFDRVQTKLRRNTRRRGPRKAEYPLVGLIFCGHCNRPMWGKLVKRGGRTCYQYRCSSNTKHGSASGCGHYTIGSQKVMGWLVPVLQRMFLGPGREALVAAIREELNHAENTAEKAARRLSERLRELDRQIDRLRDAIARIDDGGLVDRLRQAKQDRDAVAAELAQRGVVTADRADEIAGRLWNLAEALDTADPATLRELLREVVYRITCWWDTVQAPSGRKRYVLREGHVELRDNPLLRRLCRFANHAEAG